MVPSRLPELARCAWLGEHLVRELHDVVQVDVVDCPLYPVWLYSCWVRIGCARGRSTRQSSAVTA